MKGVRWWALGAAQPFLPGTAAGAALLCLWQDNPKLLKHSLCQGRYFTSPSSPEGPKRGFGQQVCRRAQAPSLPWVVLGSGCICVPCAPSSCPNITFCLSQDLFLSGKGQPAPAYMCFTLFYPLPFLVSRTDTAQVRNMKALRSCSSGKAARGQSAEQAWVQHLQCQAVMFSTPDTAFFLRGLDLFGVFDTFQ